MEAPVPVRKPEIGWPLSEPDPTQYDHLRPVPEHFNPDVIDGLPGNPRRVDEKYATTYIAKCSGSSTLEGASDVLKPKSCEPWLNRDMRRLGSAHHLLN